MALRRELRLDRLEDAPSQLLVGVQVAEVHRLVRALVAVDDRQARALGEIESPHRLLADYPAANRRLKSLADLAKFPFTAKKAGKVGTYRVGSWPSENRAPRSQAYSNPAGFIRVTPDNQDTRVSEHFRLRDFLTKDAGAPPKTSSRSPARASCA